MNRPYKVKENEFPCEQSMNMPTFGPIIKIFWY